MSVHTIGRDALVGVSEWFVNRWSPRAFSGEPVAEDVLARAMEAARWAPSAFNEQPWCFYTSTDETFNDYLGLLVESNQAWCKDASVIGFLVGRKHFTHNGNANGTYVLDCGAAWMSMALQLRLEGLYSHGLAGIQHQAVADYLQLNSDEEQVLMGFAIGHIAAPDKLPPVLQEREKPSPRKPLTEIWRQS
ncbi:nitroreductase family protein [Halioxenophilus sp. WMMB6]|uniref:nitroreductase family protein n=1 Tax=Halioxenophilus sp. WMMB6 TaxID=3073815 RepID=UPI00295F393B|nr:nitroreductase family protein [Halioxenophilus sp. WMMB6]